jgi:uncharacterized membrane protein
MTGLARIIVPVVFIALGALWSLQGAGLLGGSFMTGDRTWLTIGIVMIVVGLVLLVLRLRRP